MAVNNIKTLCVDMVQSPNSGHPGAPLGLSQFIHILYTEFINLNPEDPKWLGRDIFILSNGHACAIQYVMNYLLGFITLDDLKSFRSLYLKDNSIPKKLNRITPGHPEKNDHGIEISTGPLGQGVAASVGFAISCKLSQSTGNQNNSDGTIDGQSIASNENTNLQHVYCVFGDGCYQEGISQEAFSTCSNLGLDNITFIYDYNKTTIDGTTSLSMNESVVDRFKSLNFEVIEIQDEPEAIREALRKKVNRTKVIILHTKIGKDSELEGSCKSHGSPLGEENVRKLKDKLGIPQEDFYVSNGLLEVYNKAKLRMKKFADSELGGLTNTELGELADLKLTNTELGKLANYKIGKIEAYFDTKYNPENLATRTHFNKALNQLKTNVKFLCGCADLTPSINSKLDSSIDISNNHTVESDTSGDTRFYIRYGIREHSMFAIMSGISAHGQFMPVGGTFLNFATYGLGAIRLACMDRLKVIYVLTHDSIGLGEDGPTHQPIEVLATLRSLPNLVTFRPCDGRETRIALLLAMKNERGPSAIILSRQKLQEISTFDIIKEDASVKLDCRSVGALPDTSAGVLPDTSSSVLEYTNTTGTTTSNTTNNTTNNTTSNTTSNTTNNTTNNTTSNTTSNTGSTKNGMHNNNTFTDDTFKNEMLGAYFIVETENPQIIIIATGSEVQLALEARNLLNDHRVSVVSMLSFEIFEEQSEEYKSRILNKNALKVSVEAMSTFGWAKYSDLQIGIDEFGKSGKGDEVFEYYGFTAEKIASRIMKRMYPSIYSKIDGEST